MTKCLGPELYENWKAREAGAAPRDGYEFPLFSDAEVWWQAPNDIGPLRILSTMVLEHNVRVPGAAGTNLVTLGPRSGATQVLAIRVADHRTPHDPLTTNWNETNDGSYHGGGQRDEITALLSLVSGARLRAGSVTRVFGEDDPLGTPRAIDAQALPQLRVPPPLDRVLPLVLGRHPVRAELLSGYPQLSPVEAIALVRAAKLYRDGIWIAESDPNSAWLMLVSALEVAAVQARFADSDPEAVFAALRPKLSGSVKTKGGPGLHAEIAKELAPLLGSTNRFIQFVVKYLPDPPLRRPPPAFRHDWSQAAIKKTLNRVYAFRSHALHTGVPFPQPMCAPPEPAPDEGIPAERPIGSRSRGSAVWNEADVPIYLQTFEYLARGALLKWWEDLGHGGNPGEVPK